MTHHTVGPRVSMTTKEFRAWLERRGLSDTDAAPLLEAQQPEVSRWRRGPLVKGGRNVPRRVALICRLRDRLDGHEPPDAPYTLTHEGEKGERMSEYEMDARPPATAAGRVVVGPHTEDLEISFERTTATLDGAPFASGTILPAGKVLVLEWALRRSVAVTAKRPAREDERDVPRHSHLRFAREGGPGR